MGPRLGPRMAASRWPTDWRGDLHLVRCEPPYRHTTGFFGRIGNVSKNRYISAARANYRKLPLGRLLLVALPGCMPSLEQLGQPGAEIRPAGSCATARVFPVHDRALPSMKTLIGCRNDGQGTERAAAQQHQLAWPRDAARSTSPRRSFAVRTIRLQGLDDG